MKRIDEIFDYQNGLASSNVNIVDEKLGPNFIPYLRPSKSMGNLLAGYVDKTTVDNKYVSPAFSIVVSTDGAGSHTYSYVYPYEFIGNSNTIALYPKNPDMTLEERLFYSMAITSNRYKFDYARKPKGERLFSILIPERHEIGECYKTKSRKFVENIPDYILEEGYVKACWYLDNVDFSEFEKNYRPSLSNHIIPLKSEVSTYRLVDLFDVKGTKTTKREVLETYGVGTYPYVTTKSTNNGVDGFFDYYTENGNVLTIDSAVKGYCAYQELPFTASDHVEKLLPKFEMNKYIALFLVCIISQEMFRYNYGRKYNQANIKATEIKLPSKLNDKNEYEPDWAYMENYIKSLPYSSAL